MDELIRSLSYCADRETLLFYTCCALVALRESLANWSARCLVSIRACFDQRNVQIVAHRVHVASCFVVVKRIDYDVKVIEKGVAKAVFLDPSNIVIDLDRWVLRTNRLFESTTFWHIDVVSSEKKLTV